MADNQKNGGDDTVSIVSAGSTKSKSKKDDNKEPDEMVSLSDFLSFFPTFRVKVIFAVGVFAAFLNGLTFPILAYACKCMFPHNLYVIHFFLFLSYPIILEASIRHVTKC